jgi:predicted ATPase/DNA-binding SARP family transcriptional activator/Tfp pilus assembly protein PilF
MEPNELLLFGAPQLTHNYTLIHIGRKKALGLLAYLATSDHPLTRDHLATFFWPEYTPSQAYAELRRTLSVLRQTLGDILAIDRETAFIPPDSPLYVDVRIFHNLISKWRGHCQQQNHFCEECFVALKTASEIYRDHFLAGFNLDGGEFDAWQTLQEQTLRNLLGSALKWLTLYHSGNGDLETAIAVARRWLGLDPLNEPAHILLMQLLAKSGQRAAAMRQFEECEKVLLTELGLPPQAETIQIFKSILNQQEQQPIGHCASFISELNRLPKHNLPFQTFPFVGRERLENDIKQNLQNPSCRLLSLTGPGGSGKSRLAIEVGRKHLKEFPDGVYFVRLAACESVAEIVPLIAKVLGLTFSQYKESKFRNESAQNVPLKQQLLGFLQDKTMLIIVDNFEHLLGGVDLLIDILEAAPHVLLLVTSRVRLNTVHEYVCPVPGFDLPEEFPFLASNGCTDDFAKYGAVRFFEQCAQMTAPQFKLKQENQAYILHICRAVGGMPLGILLATAWLAVLDPQEICAEIDQNFDFLETTLYGLPERQRSMRAVFNHTWRLLSDHEQRILEGLSVFQGGFSRQAAGFITGASLFDIKTLTNKWLIERDHQGRFIQHELLRQYLSEKLDEDPGERIKSKDKHLKFFTNFLQKRSDDLEGDDSKQALAELGLEIENIRAAWNWALDQRNLEAIEQSLEGLAKFYVLSARYLEGESAFAKASEILTMAYGTHEGDEKNDLLLGKILIRLGLCYLMQGLVCQARETLRKGLGLLQDSVDRKELAYALLYMAYCQTTVEEQRIFLDKALPIFTEIKERKGIAYVHTALGYILFSQGNFQKTRQVFYESLEIHRQLENSRDIAYALGDLGYIHWILGDYPGSFRCFQESLDLMEEQNDQDGIAVTYNHLALVFASWKDYEQSKEFLWKRFHISKEIGNQAGIATSLTNIAECELMEGNDEKAYHLSKESYPYYKKIDERLTNADWYFRTLGESECGLGNLQAGKFHLRLALDVQIKQNELAGAAHTLVGVARYFEKVGQEERAFELLGLVISNAGCWQWVKERATTLVEKYKQEYPLENINDALERGKTFDLYDTVTALLNELED